MLNTKLINGRSFFYNYNDILIRGVKKTETNISIHKKLPFIPT